MSAIASPQLTVNYRHVLAAARNIAAAQFELHGFDLLEQAGRASSSYDLGVVSSGGMMKIMVHGSLDGLWSLVDPYLAKPKPRKCDYHRAIELWLERYRNVICCMVQFDMRNLIGMPGLYLASAAEVADILHEHAEDLDEVALRSGTESSSCASWGGKLPLQWRFSQERISELLSGEEEKRSVNFRISCADGCRDCAASYPAKCVKCLPIMN